MALYTQESIDRVKLAIDIVELVGARTELRRVGTRFTGLCPFHDERTPSFGVNPELSLFHCFGCGESGDAIGFVQKTEGLDFRESIELLADRYGIELKLENEDPAEEERRRHRARLMTLLDRAAEYYSRYLWDSDEAARARAYLSERGLSDDVLRAYRVGFSPSAWDKLTGGARRDGYSEQELVAAGLGKSGRQGGFGDGFRGRIMFPLADPRGRVLGFGARMLDEGRGPKYLNTSQNEIYHKGRQLFGLHLARGPAAKEARIVVVEGYTDVLALHQAGLEGCVAIMGTSLTEEQMAELARAANRIYLALDADKAGQNAMLRAARMAGSRDVELRVVTMPEGRDPAEIIAADGREVFDGLLADALSVPEFEVRRVLATADLSTARGRDHALELARPLIATVPERTASRDELVRHVADRLDVPTSYVVTSLDRQRAPARPAASTTRGPGGGHGPDQGAPGSAPIEALIGAERDLLAMCIADPRIAAPYLAKLTDDHLSSGPLRRLRALLAECPDDPIAALPSGDPELAAVAGEVAMRSEEVPTEGVVIRLGFLQLDLRRIDRELRAAVATRDHATQRGLWAERESVRNELEEVMGQAS